MTIFAKLTSKHQTTVPSEVREDLGLRPGDRLTFDRQGDGTWVVGKDTSSFADLAGILTYDGTLTIEDIDEAIEAGRHIDRDDD